MKKKINFHDVENLSAYLDGRLSPVEQTRLETRLKSAPELEGILADLKQVKEILRRTPQRRSPRPFTLTPKMAGLKPPVPRLVPVFSWASAVAMVVFACVLAVNQLGRLSFGAQAPMMAAAPAYGIGGGEGEPEPAMESQAEDSSLAVTPTPEMLLMTVPEATAAPENRIIQPEDEVAAKINPSPNTWIFLWPALAAVCTGIALLLRWISIRQFRRKNIK